MYKWIFFPGLIIYVFSVIAGYFEPCCSQDIGWFASAVIGLVLMSIGFLDM